ncbi:MAG: glutamate racemase [Piscinibacter sp.]
MQTPADPPSTTRRIGVFDSGVGGLSLLRALHRRLPGATLHYVADSAYAPYGERSEAEIRERSLRIAAHLLAAGAGMLVVACNTATAAAVDALRTRWPAIPVVGIEPGLKPALAASRSGRVGVMATSATLRSERFGALLAREVGERFVHLQACTGLADAIERLDPEDAALAALIERHCAPLRAARVDAVALGCTHYPLVREQIEQALGREVHVVDTSEAVAEQAARRLGATAAAGTPPPALLETTGDPARLQSVASRWLDFAFVARLAPAMLA